MFYNDRYLVLRTFTVNYTAAKQYYYVCVFYYLGTFNNRDPSSLVSSLSLESRLSCRLYCTTLIHNAKFSFSDNQRKVLRNCPVKRTYSTFNVYEYSTRNKQPTKHHASSYVHYYFIQQALLLFIINEYDTVAKLATNLATHTKR